MNIADKAGLLAGVYRVLKPGGLFTSTECSVGPGGDIIFPVPWAYDASINFLEPADVMRAQYHTAVPIFPPRTPRRCPRRVHVKNMEQLIKTLGLKAQ